MTRSNAALRLVILAILAMAASILCLRVALVQLLPPTVTVGVLAGDHPEIYFKAARLSALTGTSTSIAEHAPIAAAQAPLAEEPYLVTADLALDDRNTDDVSALLTEALRRDPRMRQARLLLLERYARVGDADGMAQQLVVLARLTAGTNEMLLATLGQFVIEPSTRSATVRALQSASLLDGVLNHLATTKADPDIILQAARNLPPDSRGEGPEWQQRLVTNLVEQGSITRARDLWARYLPKASGGKDAIYNPSFRQGMGTPPFNWILTESQGGVAEIRDAGGVDIIYYGREPTILLSQLLTLDAGSYNFGFDGSGDQAEGSGEMSWTLTCAGADTPFATIDISSTNRDLGRLQSEITVSPNCRAQWLRLVGLPAGMPRTRTLEIRQVSLEPAA